MSFVFEGLLGGTITLAALYLLLCGYVYMRLLWLQANTPQGLNTRKLFVMSILLTCILRFMSFASMTLLTLGSVHFQLESGGIKSDDNDDDSKDGSNKEFFAKASVVLFDFPDFCFVSAYVLLLIVWAETYLKSRRHWLSSMRFQQVWIWSYLIFNTVLYTTQSALYCLLFIPTIDEYVQTNLIYLTLAAFNLFLPVCWIVVYFYLAILFAGFPYSSRAALRRLSSLSYLGFIWTTTRLGWGLIALTSVLQHWITEARRSTTFYTICLVCIFLLTEVLPILVSLQPKVLQSLSEQEEALGAAGQTSVSSGSTPHYSNYVVLGNSSHASKESRVSVDDSDRNSDEFQYNPASTSFSTYAAPPYQPAPPNNLFSQTRLSDGQQGQQGQLRRGNGANWSILSSDGESAPRASSLDSGLMGKSPPTSGSPSTSLWDRMKGLW